MLGKIKMRNILLIGISLYLGTYLIASSGPPCHPICQWQCNIPVCPAICDTVCEENLCQETACDDPDCQCSSFGSLETLNCSSLANDCPICELGRTGIDCLNSQNQSCTCVVRCQTKACNLVCHQPNCPQPQCELVCEDSSCQLVEMNK